jgi:hypothetical protein
VSALFEEILYAPDRDRCPGARPVVSWRPNDDREFLARLEQHARRRYELERRGVHHGHWAELDPRAVLPTPPGRRKLEAILNVRWLDARPVVLPGLFSSALHELETPLRATRELRAKLPHAGALRAWLASRADLAPEFAVLERTPPLVDPERDIERVDVRHASGAELWVKSGRLSTYEPDRSLRLRLGFGAEGDDDASHDESKHALVTELAERLLPEAQTVARTQRLHELLARFTGGAVSFTQHIAYWNAAHGGAAFHHDAFDEPFELRQLGVCYAQLSGRTAWLALSIDDLAERVEEFVDALAEGEMDWLRPELCPDPGDLARIVELAGNRPALLRELALPDCGSLRRLVNRGPEFTSLLADAGHAFVLHAGDVMLLPNHGLARTAMHSVFAADRETSYALSLAIRADRATPRAQGSADHHKSSTS